MFVQLDKPHPENENVIMFKTKRNCCVCIRFVAVLLGKSWKNESGRELFGSRMIDQPIKRIWIIFIIFSAQKYKKF